MSANSSRIQCRREISPGWRVQLLVNSTSSMLSPEQLLWEYQTNLTGTDVRLVEKGVLMQPPPAPSR